MDFIDELKQFSAKVEKIKDKISTEEATKTSLIMPFFQLLGYDVFDPHEFMAEVTADVGIKKGEKVDYAIIRDGNPLILIEAKWCGDSLDKYDSQLFRYFGTLTAKFAILTNGVIYRFYTDLDKKNRMDIKPFLEVNILDIRESQVNEIKKFCKTNFDVDTIFNSASELKYAGEIIKFMSQQMKEPTEPFIKYILSEVYSGVRTQSVIEKFRDIIKRSLNQLVTELMNDKITTALKNNNPPPEETPPAPALDEQLPEENPVPRIVTTEEEFESYFIVKQILSQIIPREKITHKDTERYFGILYDNNTWKWICRFSFERKKKFIFLPDENKTPVKYQIDSLEDIYKYEKEIIAVATRYIT